MRLAVCALGLVVAAWGQPIPANMGHQGPPPPPRSHGPLDGPSGKWWDRPEIVSRLGITPDQQKKLEDIFQQNRSRLMDLHAALEKEEAAMDEYMKGPQLDDSKILPAVDRIALARAELEKADARLLLAMRHVLTPEQWHKLSANQPRPRAGGPPPGGPPHGPPPPREE